MYFFRFNFHFCGETEIRKLPFLDINNKIGSWRLEANYRAEAGSRSLFVQLPQPCYKVTFEKLRVDLPCVRSVRNNFQIFSSHRCTTRSSPIVQRIRLHLARSGWYSRRLMNVRHRMIRGPVHKGRQAQSRCKVDREHGHASVCGAAVAVAHRRLPAKARHRRSTYGVEQVGGGAPPRMRFTSAPACAPTKYR